MYAIDAGVISTKDIASSWQGLNWRTAPGGVSIIVDGQRSVRVTHKGHILAFDCTSDEFASHWYNYFNMGYDHDAALDVLTDMGGVVARHIKAHPGVRIVRKDPFEALLYGALVSWTKRTYYEAGRVMRVLQNGFGDKKRGGMADSGIVTRRLFPQPDAVASSGNVLEDYTTEGIAPLVVELARDVRDGWLDPCDLSEAANDFPYLDPLAVDLATLYRDGSLDHLPPDSDVRSFLRHRYGIDDDIFVDWYLAGSEQFSGLLYQHALCCMLERRGWDGPDC